MITEESEFAVSVRLRFAVPSQSNAEAEGTCENGKEAGKARKTESVQHTDAFVKFRSLFEKTFIRAGGNVYFR